MKHYSNNPICYGLFFLHHYLSVVTYTVEVYTGSKPGADTEASIYIELYGKRGDSGRRILYSSKNNDVKFQGGQVDVFSLEAVDLDGVEKVVIGHSESGKGQIL